VDPPPDEGIALRIYRWPSAIRCQEPMREKA
jgi:hypothetical protein